MKKLSLKNLKLDGNDLLQREQLKTVFGGYNGGINCRLTVLRDNGGRNRYEITVDTDNGDSASASAQTFCGMLVSDSSNNINRCFYDCEHDGYHQ